MRVVAGRRTTVEPRTPETPRAPAPRFSGGKLVAVHHAAALATVPARRRSLIDTLTADAQMQTVYDMTQGSVIERFFFAASFASGFSELGGDKWPCEQENLVDIGTPLFRDGDHCAVYLMPDKTLVLASLHYGWMNVHVCAPGRDSIGAVVTAFRSNHPASYLTVEDEGRVPITFWTNSNYGPVPRLRKIDAAPWSDVEANYTAEVREELGRIMSWKTQPEADGQLFLWQGPPGTGKTWALRALASEWSSWAEFHYITDPDSFFVQDPSYMINVLLADSYDVIDQPTGDVYQETDAEGKWRVLILEDTGELLAANAKESYGQGLSRLLNVVDGMIGQGLRVLALVTTNDELGDMHPAVKRPGRCASALSFGPLTDAEAQAWTGDPDATSGTLAELYSLKGKGIDALAEKPAPDIREQIAAVAEQHQEEAVGYGQAAWDEESRTVLYVSGDWTDPDPIEADMLAIEGVDHFEHEAEGRPTGWCSADIVYGGNPFEKSCEEQAALAASVVARVEADPETLRALVADELAKQTPMNILASAVEALASRPQPDVHVHMPDLNVSLPEQQLSVTVEPQLAAPHIDVHMPEHKPDIIHVAAPDVHVQIDAPAPPRPTVAVPIRDDSGKIVRVEHRPVDE